MSTNTSAVSPIARTTDLVLIALFAAVIAALGLYPGLYPSAGSTVPITMQSAGVMLAGGILGWRRGFLSVLLFLALVALGAPLLAGGRGGLGVFEGPSAGFLIGFPFGAAVVGLLSPPGGRWATSWWRIGLAMVIGGIVVVYAFGIPGMAWKTGLSLWQATKAAWVFVPGDLLKVVIATFVTAHVRSSGLLDGRGAAGTRT